jgi:hypothetical protein
MVVKNYSLLSDLIPTLRSALFALERINRVLQRRLHALKTHRQKSNDHRQCARSDEHPPLQFDAVGEIGEPLLHKIPDNDTIFIQQPAPVSTIKTPT